MYAYDFASWSGYSAGMKVEGDMNFYASYTARLLDLVPPTVIGVIDGERYYGVRTVTVGDAVSLASVTFDGGTLPLVNGKVTLTLLPDGKTHIIRALDMVGHETVVTVTGVDVPTELSLMMQPSMALLGKEAEIHAALEILALYEKELGEETESDTASLAAQVKAQARALVLAYRDERLPLAVHSVTSDCPYIAMDADLFSYLMTEEDTLLCIRGGNVYYSVSIERSTEGGARFTELADALSELNKDDYLLDTVYTVRITRHVSEAKDEETRSESVLHRTVTLTLRADKIRHDGMLVMTHAGASSEETGGTHTVTLHAQDEKSFALYGMEKDNLSMALIAALGAGLGTALMIALVAYFLLYRRGGKKKEEAKLPPIDMAEDTLIRQVAEKDEVSPDVLQEGETPLTLDERFDVVPDGEETDDADDADDTDDIGVSELDETQRENEESDGDETVSDV